MPSAQGQIGLLVDEFIFFLETKKKYSPLTIRNYSHYLNRFCSFCRTYKVTKLDTVDAECVEKYKKELAKYNLSKKTLGFHLIALRSFIKWLKENGKNMVNLEQIKIPKAGSSRFVFLSGIDVEKLFNTPDIKTVQGIRDRAILELFYATGLRVSELTYLNTDSINQSKNEISVDAKNRRKRVVFLSVRALNWLENYINIRKDNLKPLFISHKGKPTRLTPRSVQRMIKKYAKLAGLATGITPKTLRHSFATDLLTAGAEVGNIQKMLGHKNISTTQIYTHVTNKQLKDIHETFHGRGK